MTSTHKYHHFSLKSLLLVALLLCISACGKDDSGNGSSEPNDAYWKISSTVSSTAGSSAIILTGSAGKEWNAEITEGNQWCSFSSTNAGSSSKTGALQEGLNVLYAYYNANTGSTQRNARITFQYTGETAQTFDLVQLAQNQQNLPAFNVWAELPENKANQNYQYTTHYAKVNNKTIRNYSICFDKTKKAALWVAYPLHNVYLNGNGSRTDAWAFDPIVSENFQPNCVKNSYKGSYDRGHQLPSADRLATNELNAQTFYMTNMTPQLNRLNQDMWAKLETKVRTNRCSDTLYVVTGAYFGNSATITTDGVGNTAPVPTNYFKVLLRTKSGSTGKAIKECNDSDLISIGFWVEHKSYGNVEPPRAICTTVADIEAKTGFSFFPQVSNTVKQQNSPSQWNIN